MCICEYGAPGDVLACLRQGLDFLKVPRSMYVLMLT